MAAQPEPATISWRDALNRIIETGQSRNAAVKMLTSAVLSGSVGYYPRRALPLTTGLFDPETGIWRMHTSDSKPWFVQIILADFERQFVQSRPHLTAAAETKSVDFLAKLLEADNNLKRDDAWKACGKEFPGLSERGFLRIWPKARQAAGLQPAALAGRKPTRKA